MTVLADLAPVIRSKNAGPTLLTIDVLFRDAAGFQRGVAALSEAVVAARYDLDAQAVRITPYPPGLALKITLPRPVIAGSPGDRDVYGAQQHVALMAVPV